MNATDLPYKELTKYLNRAYRAFYLRPRFILRRFVMSLRSINEMRNTYYGMSGILTESVRGFFKPSRVSLANFVGDNSAGVSPPEPIMDTSKPTTFPKEQEQFRPLILDAPGSRQASLKTPSA
jgi:hypothetical protein